MSTCKAFALLLTFAALLGGLAIEPAPGCCPAPPEGKRVVNADQTVVMIWDAASKTQHFIRQASFKSEADNFGFLVPSPSQPELNESGNEAFPYLLKLTEPEVEKRTKSSNSGCGCGDKTAQTKKSEEKKEAADFVRVLEEKLVAGFKASVLEASSATALVGWLKDNGYAYSPQIEEWAKPYVEAGWKITALKVAKEENSKKNTTLAAAALRMTFKTDRPVFPYREPDSKSAAETLNARSRLLRIYFIADARYTGELTKESPWTGKAVWANPLTADQRKQSLTLLKLPEKTGPSKWWLTEFEDNWPYKVAPADVYFSPDADQSKLKRPPVIVYVSSYWPTDAMTYAIAALLVVPFLGRRLWARLRVRQA